MRIINIILRIITGSVFIFSGTVKAIDPLGSAYKFHDYFQAFGIDFLQPFALPLAVLLCLAEFIAGFSVLTGIRYREGITAMSLLILFFTPLTFILALTNPVSDCGCFGDAIHLTNWQTFGKNIILFILVLVLFTSRKSASEKLTPSKGWMISGAAMILFVLFSLYNLRYLPVIDFLPYKTGNNIPDLMKIPDGAPVTRYETTFIYEKDGIKKEFTLENYPASDSSWRFIDQKSVIIEKGYEPPVHDFSIVTSDNSDITEAVLSNRGSTLLLVSRKLDLAKPERLKAGFDLGKQCLSQGIDFYILTASGTSEIQGYDPGLRFCQTDEITLKTMVRSNPGYILLKNGTIKGKWSWANIPDKNKISEIIK
jgi:uncharacterized membrane protein YphA (DoxX/SURF4 family)